MLSRKQNSFSACSPSRPNFSSTLIAQQRLRLTSTKLRNETGKRTQVHDPDTEHRKVQATVSRALEFFKRGQKSLVFCVYTKTAETIRDQIQMAIDEYLGEI